MVDGEHQDSHAVTKCSRQVKVASRDTCFVPRYAVQRHQNPTAPAFVLQARCEVADVPPGHWLSRTLAFDDEGTVEEVDAVQRAVVPEQEVNLIGAVFVLEVGAFKFQPGHGLEDRSDKVLQPFALELGHRCRRNLLEHGRDPSRIQRHALDGG